jgi:hypothetical protein
MGAASPPSTGPASSDSDTFVGGVAPYPAVNRLPKWWTNNSVVTPEGFRGPFFKQNSGPKPRQEARWSHHQQLATACEAVARPPHTPAQRRRVKHARLCLVLQQWHLGQDFALDEEAEAAQPVRLEPPAPVLLVVLPRKAVHPLRVQPLAAAPLFRHACRVSLQAQAVGQGAHTLRRRRHVGHRPDHAEDRVGGRQRHQLVQPQLRHQYVVVQSGHERPACPRQPPQRPPRRSIPGRRWPPPPAPPPRPPPRRGTPACRRASRRPRRSVRRAAGCAATASARSAACARSARSRSPECRRQGRSLARGADTVPSGADGAGRARRAPRTAFPLIVRPTPGNVQMFRRG